MDEQVLLIGAGPMAVEYGKVLNALQIPYVVIGRGKKNASTFFDILGKNVIIGGLEKYLGNKNIIPGKAIVAVGVEALASTTKALIKAGIKTILCEKPGGLNLSQIRDLSNTAQKNEVNVCLAYNRRFYASVLKAMEIIKKDGGITSFNFEFTEWGHKIEPLQKGKGVKENWFLGNSSHVVDLAFFLGGKPKEIACFTSGGLIWHPSASIFSGAGISENGALFSYQANWDAPGRWAVELLTKNYRIYLKPMEKLQIQKKGSILTEFLEIDDFLDLEYKPGLYCQVDAFLSGNHSNFVNIKEQSLILEIYTKMAAYN